VTRCDDAQMWLGHIDVCLQGKISISDFFKQDGQVWKFFINAESAGTTLPRK
jgi:hypothetical protein